MAESQEAKVTRYITEGRVKVLVANESHALVEVQGSERYVVTYDGRWVCDCPARKRCVHIMAAQLISPLKERKEVTFYESDDDELNRLLKGTP